MPRTRPIFWDFLYPTNLIVSGVQNGKNVIVIPMTIIPTAIRLSLFPMKILIRTKINPIIIPIAKYLILCSDGSVSILLLDPFFNKTVSLLHYNHFIFTINQKPKANNITVRPTFWLKVIKFKIQCY